MHAAKLETSPRLQRVLAVLRQGDAMTTRQIGIQAKVCAVNSCISELRMNGYSIECKCLGRGKFSYKLQ